MEFFRHCPQCGHRFHIELVSKNVEHVEREERRTERVPLPLGSHYVPMPEPGQPIIIEVDELRYSYKCKLCGHEWSEKHVEEHRAE
jgi:DNA-directed RNA polymerase subunit RPC12/RpoP